MKIEAQHRVCGNDFLAEGVVPINEERYDKFLKEIEQWDNHNGQSRSTITIPVVVHILWHHPEENLSDERIYSQLEVLNRDFNGENEDLSNLPDDLNPIVGRTGIQFCLAQRDSAGNPTTGIIRRYVAEPEMGASENLFFTKLGGSDAWPTDQYLNIWVANTGDFITGLGTYPWTEDTERDGVVVHSAFFGINEDLYYGRGRVATHEIGHYLGLKHLWGDGGCESDDDIKDTPNQGSSYHHCPAYPQSDCSPSEFFMNFMDYVNDECMIFFTKGQQERMLATLNTYRKELKNSSPICTNSRQETKTLTVFPNPTKAGATIYFLADSFEKISEIYLTDLLGRSYSLPVSKNDNGHITTMPNHLEAGVYFLMINDAIQTNTTKLIVIR